MAVRKRTKPKKKSAASKRTSSGEANTPSDNAIQTPNARQVATGAAERAEIVFPIAGIGASAGGLEALEELFDNMPADTGMAFVIVTHQHPGHTSMLPELLRRKTEMNVVEATEGMTLQPNHVYVGPPGGQMAILDGRLHRMELEKKEAPRLPIDYFFRSLASDQRERAICIILSGTGTDGTLGLKAIKGESGMAMVQQPQSAKYAGMPSSAISTGVADYVLPPASMPKQLLAYVKGSYLAAAALAAEMPTVYAEPLQKIFALLRIRTGNDFSAYKTNTIRRRIERRMNVHQIKKPGDYVRYLHDNPHEIDILFKELLISVTNFFRDPDAWEALRPCLEQLVISREENQMLRVWVPGCATGEEAYSIAIALKETMDKAGRHLLVQIFGTDLDAEAIDTARIGQYPDGIAVDISPQRLERYFIREDGAYRVRKEIREMVVFAPQNLIKHPPFTKLDLLSCRNLLIYLNADVQKKLLPLFHYSLKSDGLLFLGPSETVGGFTDLFDAIDKRWKVFRRKADAGALRALPEIPMQRHLGDETMPALTTAMPAVKEAHIATQIQRTLLKRFAPVSAIVNDKGDIIYIHGRTGAYLEPAPGEPRNNVVDMAREGLQIEMSAAMRECVRTGADVMRENIRVKSNGSFAHVNLMVSKIKEPEAVRGLLLITFRPSLPPQPVQTQAKKGKKRFHEDDRVAALERELQHTKESHQTTLEELETSNEELKSANEELQSINEELQSANEELETSKEEMQSLNEELTTVNTELQSKVEELSQANDDMQNLLNSTDIATVFLDNELNIKRFTKQAKELVMLRETDVGRPISELASNLHDNALIANCGAVLKTLGSKESEVRTKDGTWYLMRIMPYRTAENVIDGLVLTFVDIHRLKDAQKELSRMLKVFMASVDPIFIIDLEDRIANLNEEALRTYGFSREQLLGKPISVIVPPQRQKQITELLARSRAGELIEEVQAKFVNKAGEEIQRVLTLASLTDDQGKPDALGFRTRRVGG
jgi:two-component system CheB/CheR fusion protein